MQIEIGRNYINKTWKYLLPCLKSYGPTFIAKYNCLQKLAVGIGDTVVGDRFKDKRAIYMMIDKKFKRNLTANVLEWFRYQDFVLTQYDVGEIEDGRKHIVVIEVPKLFNDAYDEFLKGNYSVMYTQADIDYLFKNSSKEVKDLFDRTDDAYALFAEKIKNSFNTTVTKKDLIGAELDFPPENEKEVFNYTQ